MNFQDDFQGKVAIITGAAGGIGKTTAKMFAQAKAKVVIGDLKVKEGMEAVEEIIAAGGEALFVKLDLTSKQSVDNMMKLAVDTYGGVDILVNNAGVDGAFKLSLLEMDESIWDITYKVNLRGTVFTTQAVYNIFKEQNHGKIVNMSSIAAAIAPTALAPYNSSKAGVSTFTRSMAQEMASFNVNVNAVCPGFVFTPMALGPECEELAKRIGMSGAEELFNSFIQQFTLLKRPQMTEDIANMIMFLCSEGAKNVTGQIIDVDGGVCYMC